MSSTSHPFFTQDDLFACCGCVLFNLFTFFAGRAFLSNKPSWLKSWEFSKAQGWVMALFVSFITSALSIIVICQTVQKLYVEDRWFDVIAVFRELQQTEMPVSRFTALFFLSYCVMDLLVGVIYYPSELDILTAWIHHIIYIFIMLYVCLYTHCHFAFALHAIEEIPTFYLSARTIHTPFYTDGMFGMLWFIFRCVYHALMCVLVCVAFSSYYVLVFCSIATLAMHCFWFKGWLAAQNNTHTHTGGDNTQTQPLVKEEKANSIHRRSPETIRSNKVAGN